jgi:hypothetical protein
VKLRRPSHTTLIAYLALFVALGTGGAYAANTIGGGDVIDESLTGADIRGTNGTTTTKGVNGTIRTEDVAGQKAIPSSGQPYVNGSLSGWDVADGSLTGADIGPGSITGAQLDESTLKGRITRVHAVLSSQQDVILNAPNAHANVSAGCFVIGAGPYVSISASNRIGEGNVTANVGFMSSHAWPIASPTPSNVYTDGADITGSGAIFYITDQSHWGDQYLGTVVVADDTETETMNLLIYTNSGSDTCQIQGTVITKDD